MADATRKIAHAVEEQTAAAAPQPVPDRSRRRRMRKRWLILPVLVLGAAAWYGWSVYGKQEAAAAAVTEMPVRGDIEKQRHRIRSFEPHQGCRCGRPGFRPVEEPQGRDRR